MAASALAVACGGAPSPGSHASRTAGRVRSDAGPAAPATATRDPLLALTGRYQPAAEPYPQLELRADATFVYATGPRPEQVSRGDAMLEGQTLTLTQNVVGGSVDPIELAVRNHSGRIVLLRTDQRAAFDLVPSTRLGLLSRLPTDPPDTLALPDEPPQPNPAGPDGAPALPLTLLVRASFPAGADRPGLRLEVTTSPHRVEIAGCESRTPNRECGGIRRRTLGVAAWLEIVRLWWAASGPRSCTAAAESDSFYSVQVEGGETRTGVLTASADDPTLATPCGADARLVWWLASQFSLR